MVISYMDGTCYNKIEYWYWYLDFRHFNLFHLLSYKAFKDINAVMCSK